MNPLRRLQQVLAPGWHALKLFWLPFCILQALAIALVVSYDQIPALAAALSRVAEWKAQGGLLFSMISTGVAGAFVPEIFKWITRTGSRWSRIRLFSLIYSFIYFAIAGGMVDVFYRCQGVLFGAGNGIGTVLCKMFFDQLFYTPFISHPFSITWFLFRRVNYKIPLTLSAWGWPLYRDQVFPMILPGWAYWFPMTACIYSLPADLQVPLFLFAISAWSLVFMFLASDRHDPLPPPSA